MTNPQDNVENIQPFLSFISRRFVIGIQEFDNRYKIFQIIFDKKGSIFINFPYYLKNEGLISLVKFPGNIALPTDLSLVSGGKVTANRIKYSHHPDGNAHFSQSGKIFTCIRKKSVPLHEINGHLFTVQFQGIKDFEKYVSIERIKNDKKAYLKRKGLFFKLNESKPDSMKFVGRIYSRDYFQHLINGQSDEPKVFYQTGEKTYKPAFILCPPSDNGYGNYVLTITYDEIPKIDKEQYSRLTFLAGFDAKTITRNHSLDTTFLSCMYPIEDFEKLKNAIGSADFRRSLDE